MWRVVERAGAGAKFAIARNSKHAKCGGGVLNRNYSDNDDALLLLLLLLLLSIIMRLWQRSGCGGGNSEMYSVAVSIPDRTPMTGTVQLCGNRFTLHVYPFNGAPEPSHPSVISNATRFVIHLQYSLSRNCNSSASNAVPLLWLLIENGNGLFIP